MTEQAADAFVWDYPVPEFTAENNAVVTWLLSTHKADAETGRCRICEDNGPCKLRRLALEYTIVYEWLPQRIRDAKRPNVIGDFWTPFIAGKE